MSTIRLFTLILVGLLVAAFSSTLQAQSLPASDFPSPTPPPPVSTGMGSVPVTIPLGTVYQFSPWEQQPTALGVAQTIAPQSVETRQGLLGVLNGDPVPGNATAPRLIYTLTDTQGNITQLFISPAEAEPYRGQWVEVAVEPQVAAPMTSSILAVRAWSIRPVPPPTTLPQVQGGGSTARPWVTLLCRYADVPDTPHPISWFEGAIGDVYPGINHFWKQISYNQANVNGSIVVGWYNLPRPKSYYTQPSGEINWGLMMEDCSAVADPDVYFPAYYGINFWTNSLIGCCLWGVGGWNLNRDGITKSYGMTWIAPEGYNHQGIIAHEMGHGFDLPHSAASNGTDSAIWDVMSNAAADCRLVDPVYGCVGVGVISYQMNRAGWIDPARKYEVTNGSKVTLNLERLNQPTAANPYLMARIPVVGSSTRYYTVEARYRYGYDGHLPGDAVIIYAIDTTRPAPAWLVDADGGSTLDAGAMWTSGETFYDPASNIRVQVISANTTGFSVKISNNAPYSVCDDVTEIPQSECYALEALYKNAGGSNWTQRTGWLQTLIPCTWYGVGCFDGHVTTLILDNNHLQGSIPPELGDLPALSYLNLAYNNLTGSLPNTIGNLDALAVLILNDNNFNGPLPAAMGGMNQLAWVGMWHNHLSGSLPPELGQLSQLTNLLLGVNRLEGTIPETFSSLPKLEWLDLSYNQLSGDVPASLENVATLTGLNLRYNRLYFRDTNLYNRVMALDPLSLFTQTIVPGTPYQIDRTTASIMLGWLTIDYSDHGGGYEVYYATAPGGPFTRHGITPTKATGAYTVTGLQANTTYYFKLRTYTPTHDLQQNPLYSDYTSVFTATTHMAANAAPSLNYAASAYLTLTWNQVSWATAYDVEIARNLTFTDGRQPYQTSALALSVGPLGNGVYYWRVRAVGNGRIGSWSAAQTFTVQAP